MNREREIKINELSTKIMGKLLVKKNYKNKEELMKQAEKAVKHSRKDKKMPELLKAAYEKAYDKIENLTWKECQLFIEIIKENSASDNKEMKMGE